MHGNGLYLRRGYGYLLDIGNDRGVVLMDWQKEYKADPFQRMREIAQEEQERILAENSKRYENAARKTKLSEMRDEDFAKAVLGDSYADASRGK